MRRKEEEQEAEALRSKETPSQNNQSGFVFCVFSNLTTDRKRKLLKKTLVGEEAGEGLSEAADGLSFGLVVGHVSS